MRILLTVLAVLITAPETEAKIFGRRKAKREAAHIAEHEKQSAPAPAPMETCPGGDCSSPYTAYQPAYQQYVTAPVQPIQYAAPAVQPAPVVAPPAPVAQPAPPVEPQVVQSPGNRIPPAVAQTQTLDQLPVIKLTVIARDGGENREATIDLAELTRLLLAQY